MASLVSQVLDGARFGLDHGARVAWFAGQAYAMRRVVAEAQKEDPSLKKEIERPDGPVPDRQQMLVDIGKLFARDFQNSQRGIYPLPATRDTWPRRIAAAREFFKDLPNVVRRRADDIHQEVFTDELKGTRPRYYLQNFHFQSGGWMTEDSAKIYDNQVEVLFTGATEAMRRQGLVPVADWMRGRDQRHVRALDLATGPGNFVRELVAAYPAMPVIASDMSEPYVREAMRRLKRRGRVKPLIANAEALPVPDKSVDLLSAVFLFHELPAKVRKTVLEEAARVLRPGGLFVVVDSLRTGDDTDYDGLLRIFPQLFHEPYYLNYLDNPIEPLAEAAGLKLIHADNAFVSKVLAFERG